MKIFTASTNIKASPEAIWKILTDAPNYPAWDPSADRIEGTIGPGERITAYTKLSPNRAFPVKVTEFVPGQRMVWTGGMPLGLFKGVRTFTLEPQGDGSVDFAVREEFSGPLLPLFAGSLPDLNKTFQDFVLGLKAHAEAAA
ncbi:MAG: hypothetical protein BroJett011_06620 [Chloroflexota bacterium]|nr:MAG: hypothetical protein BroJett011_06620 [Chloroflexota bacterium]